MSTIKKLAALLLAIAVVASSAAIFAGVGPAVDLLASFEKEYEKQLFKAESNLLDLAETPGKTTANTLDGQARK
ncbi:hypothetical protein MHZ92_08470 [Sporosarcina sp. ACRSL]|uniref:hypothetical protein n=1 Tax=Sporosarcina sp. ACRSL TaxID=2918215 RepID=UPI001EF556C3|nr:hypothetical protein [Sporosarcina sp. ACRSL]MCG7344164.1 hypothetical protein [Sporosarcina sp. ACRSL]